jgi:heme-degrading monooxygenase HmoA
LIVRVLRGRVPPDRVRRFREQAELALQDARRQEGLVYAEVGRQAHQNDCEEIIFVSVWRDMAAVYAWVGTDLLTSPLMVGVGEDLFAEFDVQHYEVVGLFGGQEAELAGGGDGVEDAEGAGRSDCDGTANFAPMSLLLDTPS